jgi:dihydrofolate reductase
VEDFPEQKPLPGRENIMLTRTKRLYPGFTMAASPEDAARLAENATRAMVIGGGSIYRQMLPMCDTAYVTKVHATVESDTFFPNLDDDENWMLAEILHSGEENGIAYEMCLYKRKTGKTGV